MPDEEQLGRDALEAIIEMLMGLFAHVPPRVLEEARAKLAASRDDLPLVGEIVMPTRPTLQ